MNDDTRNTINRRAVIAGGLGTRMGMVLGKIPKLLAPISGRPYLVYLLDWLRGFGAVRIILGLGHQAQAKIVGRKIHGVSERPSMAPCPGGGSAFIVIECAPFAGRGRSRAKSCASAGMARWQPLDQNASQSRAAAAHQGKYGNQPVA